MQWSKSSLILNFTCIFSTQFLPRYLHHRAEHFLLANIHPNNHQLSRESHIITATCKKKMPLAKLPNQQIMYQNFTWIRVNSKISSSSGRAPRTHTLCLKQCCIFTIIWYFSAFIWESMNHHILNKVLKNYQPCRFGMVIQTSCSCHAKWIMT